MTAPIVLSAGALQVVFTKQGDRYRHEVFLRGEAETVLLLTSQEGDHAQRWPASPALQELHVEDRPRGVQAALLVGMAGSSHWSLSCELHPATSRVAFEAACRLREAPDQLGSLYRLAAGVRRVGDTLETPVGRCALQSVSEAADASDRLRFTIDTSHAPLPHTAVWSYSFSRP